MWQESFHTRFDAKDLGQGLSIHNVVVEHGKLFWSVDYSSLHRCYQLGIDKKVSMACCSKGHRPFASQRTLGGSSPILVQLYLVFSIISPPKSLALTHAHLLFTLSPYFSSKVRHIRQKSLRIGRLEKYANGLKVLKRRN